MNSQEVINILKMLPEYRLRLIEFAKLVTDEDGEVDMDKVTFYAKELDEAISEAKAYSEATKDAILCLKRLVHS